MKLTEKNIEINGKKYQYLDTDLGEQAILFVHGLGSNKDIMPKIFNSFLKDYRCIFLDLPGHNKLPDYNFEKLDDFADYIINFIEGTHMTNFSLVGFSYGGLISIVTQKNLNKKGIKIKAVAWASPLRKDFLTLRAKIFLKIVDNINKKFYRKLPGNIYFRFVVALLGIKVTDDELNSFKHFDNNLLDKFHQLMPDHFINTTNQEILYIFGSKDPLINEKAIKKTIVYGEYQKKIKITKGGHYMTKQGKKLAHDYIKEFLK